MLFRWEFHREEDVLKITSEVLRKLLVQYTVKDFEKKTHTITHQVGRWKESP